MQHHKHPGLAGYLSESGSAIEAHPETELAAATLFWLPVPDRNGEQKIEALEGVMGVPSRAGAMRLVSVPHIVTGLSFGDELAVGDWDGEIMARGELAHAYAGSLRIVMADEASWQEIARPIDIAVRATTSTQRAVFDVIADHALAATIPYQALTSVFELLNDAASNELLRWEYATANRHSAGEAVSR